MKVERNKRCFRVVYYIRIPWVLHNMFSVIDKINLDTRQKELERKRKSEWEEAIVNNYIQCMMRVKEAHETPVICTTVDVEMATAVKERIDTREPLLRSEIIGTKKFYPSISITLKD